MASQRSTLIPPDTLAKFTAAYTRNRPLIQKVLTTTLALYIAASSLGGLGTKNSKTSGGGKSKRRSKGGKGGDDDKPERVQVCDACWFLNDS